MHILSHYVMGLLIRRRSETFNRLSIFSLFIEVRERLGFFGGLFTHLAQSMVLPSNLGGVPVFNRDNGKAKSTSSVLANPHDGGSVVAVYGSSRT